MSETLEHEEQLRETQYPALRVLTGGKGPPAPPGGNEPNWLAELDVACTFTARRRDMPLQIDWSVYYVIYKSLPSLVLMEWRLPDGKIFDLYADPQRFSNQYELGVILGIENEAAEADGGYNDSEQCDPH